MPAVLEARELWKIYDTGMNRVEALRKVSVSLSAGEMVAVMGPSGCGKTTVLEAVCGLRETNEGQIFLGEEGGLGCPIGPLKDNKIKNNIK